jgi:hypothetical protein
MEEDKIIREYGQKDIISLDIYKSSKFLTRIILTQCNIEIVDIDLPNLIKLDLIDNNVHTILKIPQTLKELDLSYNKVTKNYSDLSNLEYLCLRNNNLTDCSFLHTLSNNCGLSLDKNPKLEKINSLPKLRTLSIENTNVRSLDEVSVTVHINTRETKIKYLKQDNFEIYCGYCKFRYYKPNMCNIAGNRIKCIKRSITYPDCNKIKDYSYSETMSNNKFLVKIQTINWEFVRIL